MKKYTIVKYQQLSFNKLASLLFMLMVFFFFTKAFNQHNRLIHYPNQTTFREGANLVLSDAIINGKNLFAVENQPELYSPYGFMYPFALKVVTSKFGNTLQVHRRLNQAIIFLSLIFLSLITINNRKEIPFIFLALYIIYCTFLWGTTPVSSADALGLLLFFPAVLLPFRYQFSYFSLAGTIVLSTLLFFTKAYMASAIAVVLLYTFFFISRRKAVISFLLFIVFFVLFLVTLSYIYPTLVHTSIFTHTGAASTSFNWMILQLKALLKTYYSVFIIFILVLFIKNPFKIRLSDKLLNSWHFWRNSALLKGNFDYLLFCGFVLFILFLYIGQHKGNYLLYAYHTFFPFMVLFTLKNLSHVSYRWLFLPLLLLTIYHGHKGKGYFDYSQARQNNWLKLEQYISSSKNPITAPILVDKVFEHKKQILDNGLSEYIDYVTDYEINVLHMEDVGNQLKIKAKNAKNEVREAIANKKYDVIIMNSSGSWLLNRERIEKQYHCIDSVNLYMPAYRVNWKMLVYKPL